MVGIGDGIFVHIPRESRGRVLHPAKIVGAKDEAFVAELEEAGLSVKAEQIIVVYYEQSRRFMQQAAHVESVLETAPKLVISVAALGKPFSADDREHYRVSTVMSGLAADIGQEQGCKLLDVSVIGFSCFAGGSYALGELVDATLHYGNESFCGKASVQSSNLIGGQTRYGLRAISDKHSGGDILKGLGSMTVAIQRQQLQRLAGVK